MFTGIIEELGTIGDIKTKAQSMQLTILAKIILSEVKLGDSIAVNGVCLTVTSFADGQFTVDVMPETYIATSLAKIKINDKVNLESALRFNGKLGGHFVTGHVDGIGLIKQIANTVNAINYTIELDKNLMQYCIYKGSIAVDGTSLTIFGIGDDWLNIALIPHTVKNSVIGSKKIGDIVNIECDMLGKYVLNLAKTNNLHTSSNITKEILAKNGFI
ncbi:MAG: ribE [Burkholderiales bacterium]|jgi:riboflavin synthase|nr:ribE [Burkholderiales bacterium]MCE3268445.1 ribE [Burkholderiales bacterium]